jgi:2-phospho-L-lactate guanylyltransferase (CobY/MobA/RfbA family)
VLGNKIIGKDKRTGHYVKIAESDRDDTDIEDYDDVAANRTNGKNTAQKEAIK